ncbi:MAG: hypothetical protein JSU94_12380 [Phycisphaerales bacterium]|nr:MAG: hypothetical protein JSU94_12380 [Phycisphaerales bacterium]
MDTSENAPNTYENALSPGEFFSGSVLGLLLANLIVIIWAMVERWSLAIVVWIYWGQSVIMGVFWLCRIVSNIGPPIRPVTARQAEPSDVALRNPVRTAAFFLFHYTMFHFLLVGALAAISEKSPGRLIEVLPMKMVVLLAVVFVVEQYISFKKDLKADRGKRLNVRKSAVFLYAHVIPIHVTIFIGLRLHESGLGHEFLVPVFLIAKTGADVVMHVLRKHGYEYESESSHTDFHAGFKIMWTARGGRLELENGRVVDLADQPELVEKLKRVSTLPAEIQREVVEGLVRKEEADGEIQPQLRCMCDLKNLLEGPEARRYAEDHLELVRMDSTGLLSEYKCPSTQKRWILAFTGSPGADPAQYCTLRAVPAGAG